MERVPARNPAFLAKAIDRAQRLTIDSQFCAALHEYIIRETDIVWDDKRALFWVAHPQGFRVCLWFMPLALQFQPTVIQSKKPTP